MISVLLAVEATIMYLTTEEIIDLAEYAGLSVTGKPADEQLEAEYFLNQNITGGIAVYDEEKGTQEFYKTIVKCDGCEVGEAQPLGKPLIS